MRTSLIFISLALAIGVAIGVVIQNDPETPDLTITTSMRDTATVTGGQNAAKNPVADRTAAEIIELNQLLRNEISARLALEQKLEALGEQVAALGSNLESIKGTGSAEQVADDPESDVAGSDRDWFNEQALIDSGMDSRQASELKINFEQLELERLYLRDQSIRESWSREKFREAMQVLAGKEEELKNQLSESEYDAYLYATGQSNRVAVSSVLANAQAGTAGIMSGDYIIRYDNQRVYNWLDLREATAGGNASDIVALEVERDGNTIEFYLARGPLGIRMNSVSVAP